MFSTYKYRAHSSNGELSWMSGRTRFFPVSKEIIYSFLVYFGILQIWPMSYSLYKRVWFTTFFLPLKQSLTLFQLWIIFAISSLILPHLELSRIESPKLTATIIMEIKVISFVLVDQLHFYVH